MKLTELSKLLGKSIIVTYFPDLGYWRAGIQDVEVKEGIGLLGVSGDGKTPGLALDDYASRISNKRIVVDAYGPTRQELNLSIVDNILYEERY